MNKAKCFYVLVIFVCVGFLFYQRIELNKVHVDSFLNRLCEITVDANKTKPALKNLTECRVNLDPKQKIPIITNVSLDFDPFQTRILNITGYAKRIKLGGRWTPKNCKAKSRVAIILPFKNRDDNLRIFLYNMHPFLQKQKLSYSIFVVEHVDSDKFNKGKIMNAAFNEIIIKASANFTKPTDFDCVVFHDVDLLPTSHLNLYECPQKIPKHLSIVVGKTDWSKIYPILVGGVLFFRIENYIKVNGFSNRFWGWGAEDDDMYYRLKNSGIGFDRPKENTVYEMLQHLPSKKNDKRVKLLNEGRKNFQKDGLNDLKYKLKGIIKYRLFTHILVDIGVEEVK